MESNHDNRSKEENKHLWGWTSAVLLLLGAGLIAGLLAGLYSFFSISSTDNSARQRAETIEVARAYQLSVDQYLRSGDATELLGILSGEFLNHHPAPGAASNGQGLIELLSVLRQSVPGVSFSAELEDVDEDRATMQVLATASGSAWFPAPPGGIESREWRFEETLRIAKGQVVERWGTDVPFRLQFGNTGWQRNAPGDDEAIAAVDQRAVRILQLTATTERLWLLAPVVFTIDSGSVRLQSLAGFTVVHRDSEVANGGGTETAVVVQQGDIVYSATAFLMTPLEETVMTMVTEVDAAEAVMGGDLQSEEFYARPLGPDGFVQSLGTASILTLVEFSQERTPRVLSLDRTDYLLPVGGELPNVPTNALQIVSVISGELRRETEPGVFAVATMLTRTGATTTTATIDAPSRVSVLTVTFDQLESEAFD